jgi:hypothetical protein
VKPSRRPSRFWKTRCRLIKATSPNWGPSTIRRGVSLWRVTTFTSWMERARPPLSCLCLDLIQKLGTTPSTQGRSTPNSHWLPIEPYLSSLTTKFKIFPPI